LKKGALISRNESAVKLSKGVSLSDENDGFDKYMNTPEKSASSKLK